MHQAMAATLDAAVAEIRGIWKHARRQSSSKATRPRWPMIVLRSPKGWTGPKEIRGKKVEGYWRSHQVPFSDVRGNPRNLKLLESWLRSYEPEKLFDAEGKLRPELKALAPAGAGAWARTATRTAACCARICGCPIFTTTPWR